MKKPPVKLGGVGIQGNGVWATKASKPNRQRLVEEPSDWLDRKVPAPLHEPPPPPNTGAATADS